MANANKNAKSANAPVFKDQISRIARIAGITFAQALNKFTSTRKTLLSLGVQVKRPGGRTIVFGKKPFGFSFNNAKHVTKSKALVKDPIDCPIAKALQDSWFNDYITSYHVGNSTVTMWSKYCPDIVVKYLLGPDLMEAVRNWDEQKGKKNRRFRLSDGVHYLTKCPPSYITGKRNEKNVGTRGQNHKHPTRRLTVKSDISLAVLLSSRLSKKSKKKSA